MSLETLRPIKHPDDFREALEKLPQTLAELYTIIYDQIEATGIHERLLAIRTLQWLLCARRLLSTAELIAATSSNPSASIGREHASSTDSDDTDSDDEAAVSISPDDVRRACRQLVIVDSTADGDEVFRLAHPSVQEYLTQRTDHFDIVTQNMVVVERCLDVFLMDVQSTKSHAAYVQQNEELQEYAAFSWPKHYTTISENLPGQLVAQLQSFLFRDGKTSSAYKRWADYLHDSSMSSQYHSEFRRQTLTYGLTHMRRLANITMWLDPNHKERLPLTPVTLLSAFGFSPLMEILEANPGDTLRERSDLLGVAAREGHEEMLTWLLANGVNVNGQMLWNDHGSSWGYRGMDGWCTPLHCAVRNESWKIVKLLIDSGASIDPPDGCKQTPLVTAASLGLVDIVQLLISGGAHLEGCVTDPSPTPLSEAAKYGRVEVATLLLDVGAKVDAITEWDETPLHRAAAQHLTDTVMVVRLLLEKGAQVNAVGNRGQTPLHHAVFGNDTEKIRLLLEKGAHVNAVTKHGSTILHDAMSRTDVQIVRLLLEKGAQVNVIDENDQTPLHSAVENGKGTEVVRLLLEKGAQVDAVDTLGHTPLHSALEGRNDIEIVRLLVEKGAQVNTMEFWQGKSPLHFAVLKTGVEILGLLLERGAQVNGKDRYGRTPLHWVVEPDDNVEIVRLLLEKGAQVNAVDQWGVTPLHLAARCYSNSVMVQLLLENSANTDLTDKSGFTAFDRAAEVGNYDVRIFLEHAKDVRLTDTQVRRALYLAKQTIRQHEEVEMKGKEADEDGDGDGGDGDGGEVDEDEDGGEADKGEEDEDKGKEEEDEEEGKEDEDEESIVSAGSAYEYHPDSRPYEREQTISLLEAYLDSHGLAQEKGFTTS